MSPDRRLTFYNAPARQGFWAGAQTWLMDWLVIIAVAFFVSLFVSLFFAAGQTCEIDPYAHGSTLDGWPVCSSADTLQFNGVVVLILAVTLILALLLLLLQVMFPHRWLALTVTPHGVASSYARYAHPVIAWAEIESLGLYEAPPDKEHARPTIYLTVTVRSPEEVRDSEAIRLAWSEYPTAPDMDRVALMWPIGRVLDSGGNRLNPDTITERIQQEFAPELAEYGVTVFALARAL